MTKKSVQYLYMKITINKQINNPTPAYPFFAHSKGSDQSSYQLILVMGEGINSFCYDAFLVSSKSDTYLPFQYRSGEWTAHEFIPFTGDINIKC